MRKGQEKAINRAKHWNVSEDILPMFYDEQYSLWVYDYFIAARHSAPDVILRNLPLANDIRKLYPYSCFHLWKIICDFDGCFDGADDINLYYLARNSSAEEYVYLNGDIQLILNIPTQCKTIYLDNGFIVKFRTALFSAVCNKPAIREDFNKYLSYCCFNVTELNANEEFIRFDSAMKNNMRWEDFSSADYQKLRTKESVNYYFSHSHINILEELWGNVVRDFIPSINLCSEKWEDRSFKDFASENDAEKDKIIKENGLHGTIDVVEERMSISRLDFAVFFSFTTFSSRTYKEDRECASDQKPKLYVLLTEQGKVLYRMSYSRGAKYMPLSLKKATAFSKRYKRYFPRFIKAVMQSFIDRGVYFAKDLLPYFDNGLFMLPGSINEILEKHNKSELMAKYKIWQNPNRADLNIIYAASKLMPYVTESSKGLLRNLRDGTLLYEIDACSDESFVLTKKTMLHDWVGTRLFVKIISRNVNTTQNIISYANELEMNSNKLTEDDVSELQKSMERTIKDYVVQCFMHKKPVNLKTTSIKKILSRHHHISEDEGIQKFLESDAVVEVPVKSKFNKLRELLPDSFEWITTKPRLAIESRMMHHCVYTYSEKITSDKSAIYSYVYPEENRRYTLEFMSDRPGHYYLAQIQKKYDRGGNISLEKYIQKILS